MLVIEMTSGHGSARSAAMVDLALAHRLTLVVAAPGWGKSALLRSLADSVPSIEITTPPSGWTPFSLARSLVDSLVRLAPGSDVEGLPSHATPDLPDNAGHATALAAAVCGVATNVVADHTLVVWDDAEMPEGSPIELFLEALVLGLPPLLHLVIACRAAPRLRIARLRASGEVARISGADLAIRPDDVVELGLPGRAAEALSEIITATGGWPIAVNLAAEALRRDSAIDRESLIDRLLTPDAVLFDYLAEEVFAGLPAADREVLTFAAALPDVAEAILCDLGRSDLADGLQRLANDGIFLEPVRGRAGHFRASPVGGAFIRRTQPAVPRDVLGQAVDWFIDQGEIESALVLSAAMGDTGIAARVARVVENVEVLSSMDALETTLAMAATATTHPRIAELYGDLHHLRGDWDTALAAYATASSGDWSAAFGDTTTSRASSDDGSAAGRVPMRLYRKRAMTLYIRGRLDEAEAVCAAAQLDGSDPSEEARVLGWQATIHWIRGDADGCESLVRRAEELARRSCDDTALATTCTVAAMLAAMRGDRGANKMLYREALVHAEHADDVVQIVRIRTNRGSRLTMEGAYEDALADLDEAIRIAELSGSETFTGLAYSNRAETYLCVGRLDDALRDLQRAQDTFTRLQSGGLHYAIGNLARVRFLRGQRREAIALFEETLKNAETQRDSQGMTNSLVGLARAVEVDDPDASLEFAERAVAVGHPDFLAQAMIAAGAAELRRGDPHAARSWADKALELAEAGRHHISVAEALLLQSAIAAVDASLEAPGGTSPLNRAAALERRGLATGNPLSAALAERSLRVWQDLGDPIGEARATLMIAGATTGPRRELLIERAEQLLSEAGAWGYLAEIRNRRDDESSTRITITTLGGFRVSRDGSPIDASEWRSRKARDVVKLLVARRGAPVVREEVAEALWPDDSDRASRKLSVVLSMIRGVLDPDRLMPPEHYVGADNDTIWLTSGNVEIDVERFLAQAAEGRRLLAAGEHDEAHVVLSEAAARYLGDFCADDPYAEWAAGGATWPRHTFVDISFELAGLAVTNGEHGEAIRHWLRILDVDPYDEGAHLGMIRSLLAQRRHGEARRAYRSYRGKLAELDLDAAPFPSARGQTAGAHQLNTA